MKKIALISFSLMLVGCFQQPAPVTPPPNPENPKRLYELTFTDANSKNPKVEITAYKQTATGYQKTALTEVGGSFTLQRLGVESFSVDSAKKRYLKARYKITNTSGKAIENIAFIPVDTDDDGNPSNNGGNIPTVGNTPIKSLKFFDGSDASSKASIISLMRGQNYDITTDSVTADPTATTFLTGLNVSGINPTPPSGLVIAEVKNYGWQVPGVVPISGSVNVTFGASYDMAVDGDGKFTPQNDPYSFSILFVFSEEVSSSGITRIHDIQGATASGDAASSMVGSTVTIDGIVTTDLQQATELGGFYVQEKTADQDSDPTTSEGIFVACDTTCLTVNQKDRIRLTGEVAEVNGETRLINISNPIVMATNQTLPAAASVTLSATATNWEQYEGMLVSTTGTVSDNSQLGRGGLVTITDLNTLPAFTQENAPNAANFTTYENEAAARTVIVDDGSLTEHPSSIIFGRGNNPLNPANTLRNGDGATVTGVVGYSGSGWTGTDAYRIHASAASATFVGGGRGPAPTDADLNNPQLKVATFDLNGFFNGDGAGSGFTTEGASNAAELTRQLDKLLEALQDLDADVIALQGLENDYAESTPAIKTLVDALNAALGSAEYTYINPGVNLGSQTTAVGLIYRTAAVTPVGSFSVLDNTDNAAYNDVRNHPALAQTFRTSGLGTFTAVAVELEDRSATCGGSDDDTTTGQGNCNGTRNTGAQVLMDWVNSDPTGSGDTDVALLGNFNAFMQEDPINTVLNGADDTNGTGDDFIQLFDPNDYTAVVNGRRGTLDYAFVNSSLQPQLKGLGIWHINAAEPSVLDYNTENKTAAQQTDLYDTNAYRSSAHDPVVIGLTLDATNVNPTDITLTPTSIAENNAVNATVGALGASDPNSGDTFTYTLVSGTGDTDNASFDISGSSLVLKPSANFEAKSSYSVRVRVTDQGGLNYEKALTVSITDVNEAPTTISLNPGTINENLAAGASAGTLSTNDPDTGETTTYTLVTGTGDTDNASFTIVGDDLRNTAAFDFETKSSYSIRVRATDSANHSVEQQLTVTVNDVFENGAPTDITLTPSSIAENNTGGATVGALAAVDPNVGDTFTFSLVSGSGDTDNGDFAISGTDLKLTPSANFETKSSYSVRVHVEDQNGAAFEKALTVTITNVNEDPTDLTLSNDSIAENSANGSAIGNFSTTDPDSGDTFSYSLVTGTGDTDNASFTLSSAGALTINNSPNFEAKSSYSIRVRTTDAGGKTFEKSFTINVSNINETPTVLSLTGNSVAENQPSGTAVGSFSTTDPDASDTFTYSLVTGTGDTDNSSFQIVGGQLQTNATFNFETKDSYSIRVRTTDSGGLFIENTFTISVTNVNETPTDLALSASSVNENVPGNTVVGTLSSTDVDAGDTFTYSLVSGAGSDDNASFNINGSDLRITSSPNFEAKSSYSVRIRTTDAGGLSFEKAFTITINDLNETPVPVNDSGLQGLGNTTLEVNKSSTSALKVSHGSASFDLLDNDTDPDTNPAFSNLTVTGVSNVTSGASVSFDANGTFHYTPAPGFTGTDTFTYTVTDAGGLSANATVSIDVQGRIWYVKNDTGSAGSGTSLSPFNQLSSAVSSSLAGDTIYVFAGNGSNSNMTTGFTLKTNQKLIGEGSALALTDITVPGSHNALSFNGRSAGTAPLISNTGGDGVSGSNVGTVVIKGLSITGSTNGVNINNNGGTHSVTLNNLTVAGATQAVALGNSSTATTTAALNNLTLNASAGTGLSLSKTAGTFNISAFDDILVSGNTTGTGINASNVNFSSITGATVAVGTSGNGTGTNGVLLDGSTGSLSFDSLNVYNDNGTGLKANQGGLTLVVSAGNVESTNGPAVDISFAPSNLNFTTVRSVNSGTTGVSLSAANTSTNMSFSAGSASTITGSTGHAFYVNSGTGNITYQGTITKNGGGSGTNAVRVTGRNGGSASTISFTNTITDGVADTAGGIYLDDNDVATINFTGQITANTQSQPAFTAINGGTFSSSATNSTLTTTSGTALNVLNTNIGSSGLKFQSISSNGAVNGIYVNGTGSAGSLSVLGTGSAGSGGTIQNTSGHAIYLIDTQTPSFDRIIVQNIALSGLRGEGNVRGFTLTNSTINNVGTIGDELQQYSNVAFNTATSFNEQNLSGAVTITGNTLTNAKYHGVHVINYQGTLTDLNVSNNTITSSTSNAVSLGSGISIIARGTGNTASNITKATINGNIITNFPTGAGVIFLGENNGATAAPQLGDTASSTNVITISNNLIKGDATTKMNANAIAAYIGSSSSSGRGKAHFEIFNNGTEDNPLANIKGNVITHTTDGYADSVVNIYNNYVSPNTTGIGAMGITAACDKPTGAPNTANGVANVSITNNTVTKTSGAGIRVGANATACTMNAKIMNNSVSNLIGAGFNEGIQAIAGGTGSGNSIMCARIENNTSTGAGGAGGIYLAKYNPTTFNVHGMPATNGAGALTYINGKNPATIDNYVEAVSPAVNSFGNCNLP
ncbi:ExeM/NucH family extracellular endonuclease [Deinococcus cellulosilyticus]|uniref:Cadherin domain-containing protein n=1 Tax=Deinococcus cellulosilyticus (strain DSM 18568 / NBRC 106333 / KACC 11606 / 5516J-15) TaxID=1223518 RepID=A0A511N3M0_DEIC1|nr:ExeM/NucH family extracellular endonuclease [Deinococcus cellulosilyticus]GEM47077.1 hypothetical protein DC3_27120 [Deinococcus cellulosilyticus NBRC 106333 = KACC 11606]